MKQYCMGLQCTTNRCVQTMHTRNNQPLPKQKGRPSPYKLSGTTDHPTWHPLRNSVLSILDWEVPRFNLYLNRRQI